MEQMVTLAAVAGAHGVRGEVRLKLFTGDLAGLKAHRVFVAAGRELTLLEARPDKMGAVARFAEVQDRNAAEAMRGTVLEVPRSALPPLGPGEYYHCDYLGREVFDEAGEMVGRVKAIENYGASDILDIERAAGGTVMVPFVEGVVSEVDGRLVVEAAFLG